MKTRAQTLLPLVVVVPLLLSGCATTDGSAASGEFAVDGSYATAIHQDPGDLNPLVTNLVAAQVVGALAYDALIFVDPATSEIHPFLADSWTDSPSEVTFTLKDDIVCADGEPFTAQTAADNFSWIVDPDNGSPLRDSVVPSSAVATAEGNVLTITTPEPSPFLLFNVGAQQLACDGALADPKSISAASNGTGMFEITEVVAGDHITLERRDGYNWAPDRTTTSDTPGVPKTVTVKIVPDLSTTANLLLSKGLNAAVVSGPDEERVAQLDSLASPNLSGMIGFNQLAGQPTADPAVRIALTQAIDLDAFTDIITAGQGERAASLITVAPKTCTYDSVAGSLPEFDEDAAAAALADAGYVADSSGKLAKDGKPLSIKLVYNNSTDTRSAAAEYVASQWEKVGVTVELSGGDQSFLLGQTFAAEDPSGWDASVGVDLQSNTPSIFPPYFSGPTVPDGSNYSSINNPEYDKLVAAASLESGDAACELWKQAEQALFAVVDIIPVSVTPFKMYFSGAESLYQPVTGILPSPALRVLK